jgi:hypothetical protein
MCAYINMYRTITLTCYFVWVLKLVSELKGKHRLKLFENRMLRRIFGPKKYKAIREKETSMV